MIRRNLLYNMMLSVSNLVFPLITFPYASRILGPQGIGAVSFIDSVTQYFILFAALGVPLYGIREISKSSGDPAKRNKIFTEILLIHLLATVLFSLVYLMASLAVKDLNRHMGLVLVGIASMYFNVFSVEWFYQGTEQFAYITKRTLIIRVFTIVLLYIFLQPGSDPIVYSVVFISALFMNSLINVILLHKHISLDFSSLSFRPHLRPLVLIFSSAIAVSVYTLMDNIILGFIKGELAVGIYATSLKVVRIPFALIAAIGGVILPQVSRAFAEKQLDRVNELINKSFAFTCILGVPIVVGLYISAGFLIDCFAGAAFTSAVGTIQILCPVVMLIGMNSLLATQLLAPMGREKQLLMLAVVCMLFSLLCNMLLIPLYSYLGAAVTNVLTELLLVVMLLYIVKKHQITRLQPRIFFQCLGIALLFLPIAMLIRVLGINYMLSELLVIVVCGLFYGTCLLLLNNEHLRPFQLLLRSRLPFIKLQN